MLAEYFIDEDFDVKRDMDLVREILLAVENSTEPTSSVNIIKGHPDREEEILYLIKKMTDAGLVTSEGYIGSGNVEYGFIELTWCGHEFLDEVRDSEIWRKTKDGAQSAGAFSFDLLKALARGFAKKQVEEYTGIKLEM